jgi:RHS repeat-associated protein
MRRTETLDYDFSTGLVTKVTDADNAVSTSTIYDAFGRPTLVRAAEGKPEESRTSVEYSDVARRVITRSDLNTLGDEKLVSIQHYDQLGRVRLTRQLEDSTTQSATDETTGIKVQTRYLFSGANSYRLASNPYRAATSTQAGGEQAMGWTRSKSDNGGRLIEVQTFPGAGLPAPWGGNSTGTGTMTTAYNANLTTVTDQTGKVRRSLTNGLGQLARVDEPDGNNNLDQSGFPSQPTSYTYDALSNLIRVNQGPQTRTFIYSSLGRLLSAQNPESGTISYQYDANGNVTRKTDARNIQTNYVYDALNRPTARSYSDSTPGITYSYDSATISNGKGRLVSASSSVSTYSYSGYDALGRVTGGSQTLGSQTYSMSYGYDRAGHITSMTYPSSRTVTNSYDGAGRANSVTGTLGDGASRTYATGITYSPLGGLKQEQFGTDTPIYNKQYYNSRGQLAEIRESTIPNNTSWNRGAIINHYSDQCWGVCAGQSMADNNGNLKKQDNYIPDNEQVSSYQTYTQFYSYDNLNRLQTVTESKYLNGSTTGTQTLSQGYGYDRFGNRTINTSQTWGGVNNLGFEVDTATNRLYSPGDLALPDGSRRMRYDDAGNQITDSYTGEGQRTYDAENRMTQAWSNGQWQSYTYDPNGQRVRRRVDGVETWQVYAIGGELLAEYAANASPGAPQKEYGYRNGQLLITAVPPTGSPSAQTNVALSSNGGTAVASSYFSNPSYGTFLPSSVNDGSRRALNNSIWLDNTYGVFPDWIEVDFNGNKTINEIDVITQQDDYQNPVEPTLTQTFTSWGITTFEVQYWNGGSWVTVPGGSVSGNNKVWRQFTFSNIITSKIRLFVNDSADHVYSRVVEVEAWTPSASGETTTYQASTNFASTQGQQNWYYLDSTGAQMTFNVGGYWQGPESYLWLWANGGHPGQNIDAVRQWRAPQSGTIRITGNVSDANTTCGDGVVVSIKKGAGVLWQQTIENGNTTGFSYDLTTSVTAGDQINFVINKRVTTNYCDGTNFDPAITLTGGGSSAGAAEINWLVSDQLGTPRMIFDKTGSLANIKRHDYLPFGEELFSGTGQRPTAQGYTGDSIRQKFTLKERDNETGLDYFGARYYGSTQGRFTSGDPASLALRHLVNPQDLNRYAYVANNPLKFIDPDGEEKIQVVIQTFIPQKSVTDPVQGRTFEGDGRNVGEPGGFRTQQIVNIETDPSRGAAQSGPFNGISGPSHELSGPGGRIIGEATASGETLEGRVTRSESGVVNIQAKGNEGNPLVSGAPGITYDFNIQVQSAGTQGNVTVTVTGSHDKFPAYEIMVIRPEVSKPSTTVVYQHDPRQTGNTALSLFPGNQKTINPPVRTVIPAPPAPAPPPQRRRGKRGEEE